MEKTSGRSVAPYKSIKMNNDPTPHSKRKNFRFPEYDYAMPGRYFVTICVHDMECLFRSVIENAMKLNRWGEIVKVCWEELPQHYPQITLDEFVVMPNHFHAILHIHDFGVGADLKSARCIGAVDAKAFADVPSARVDFKSTPTRVPLSRIVQSFKVFSTRRINSTVGKQGTRIWQRNYYEHIIRNEADYHNIQLYIRNNPLRWSLDKYYRV